MFLRALAPLLQTNDIEQTIAFYTSVLGFKIHQRTPGWCALQKDNAFLMFATGEQPPNMTGSLYVNTNDIGAIWENLKNHEAIIYSITDMPYGTREFAIKDNNGYTIRFGMNLQPATDFDKYFPGELSLESSRVQLRVLHSSDIPQLQPIAPSGSTWKYFTKELNTKESYNAWMEEALQDYGSQRRVPFVIIDKKTNGHAGSTSYGNISFFDKRIEIGWSWLGDAFKGTGVNTHAKFLLLQYAFETLGFERVEIKTDNLNERSKAALKKIGATPEGVLRNHMQMHSNRRRDSIYFSILRNEWENVKQKLHTLIA
jgi:N-acetyltransferase